MIKKSGKIGNRIKRKDKRKREGIIKNLKFENRLR